MATASSQGLIRRGFQKRSEQLRHSHFQLPQIYLQLTSFLQQVMQKAPIQEGLCEEPAYHLGRRTEVAPRSPRKRKRTDSLTSYSLRRRVASPEKNSPLLRQVDCITQNPSSIFIKQDGDLTTNTFFINQLYAGNNFKLNAGNRVNMISRVENPPPAIPYQTEASNKNSSCLPHIGCCSFLCDRRVFYIFLTALVAFVGLYICIKTAKLALYIFQADGFHSWFAIPFSLMTLFVGLKISQPILMKAWSLKDYTRSLYTEKNSNTPNPPHPFSGLSVDSFMPGFLIKK